VKAFAIGDAVKVRISGNSFAEIAQKIAQLPEELKSTPSKTICDGEPIRHIYSGSYHTSGLWDL
jgi:hypothetical protein